MTVTIGSFSTNRLTAQPFGYEGDARTGLTARTFRISGLLTAAEWQTLVSEYNSWRSTRIQDADTLYSGVVGTTIALTITNTNNLNVSSLACWFAEPPAGEQAGVYVSATVTLVDAAQALAVLLRSKEKERQSSEALTPNLGTQSFTYQLQGQQPVTVVVTLTKVPETRQDGPNVTLTATGTSYVQGPLAAHKVKQIDGYISTGTYAQLLSWYDATIAAIPSTGAWFPTSPPTATAEVIIIGGVKATRYNVSLSLVEVI